MTEESVAPPPEVETVPLEDAKKGDLIALPYYPGVGRYGGTEDVRGLKTYAMKMALADNVHVFSPSVLIGSPGQEIKLTSFEDPVATDSFGVVHPDFPG